ncbi:MAG TPA: PD-(D/E)XK nuclease family protein, partial [Gemmatimonadales bacterium]|nr:PD-(D/E)XK nuclease family protein [Gemmatimonadales bacterium]
ALEALVRAVVRDEHLASDEPGMAETVARLMEVLESVRRSPEWEALSRAETRMVECPIVRVTRDDTGERVVEGVADAVIGSGGDWTVLDWKSDDVSDEAWVQRREAYERQVRLYAEMLGALGGVQAHGELVRVRAG